MMTPRDMNRATLCQSTSRDIPVPSVALRVYTFRRFEVQGDVEMQYTLLARYISRDNIL